MDEHLQEIAGTLARTAQRKNTVLYKLHKKRQREEQFARLGINAHYFDNNNNNSNQDNADSGSTKADRGAINTSNLSASNPAGIHDEAILRFILREIKMEIGNGVEFLRADTHGVSGAIHSIRDPAEKLAALGEEAVRAKNNEINRLVYRRELFQRRLAELQQQQHRKRNSINNNNITNTINERVDEEVGMGKVPLSYKKVFFGVAKLLPEALKQQQQQQHKKKEKGQQLGGNEEGGTAEAEMSGAARKRRRTEAVEQTSTITAGGAVGGDDDDTGGDGESGEDFEKELEDKLNAFREEEEEEEDNGDGDGDGISRRNLANLLLYEQQQQPQQQQQQVSGAGGAAAASAINAYQAAVRSLLDNSTPCVLSENKGKTIQEVERAAELKAREEYLSSSSSNNNNKKGKSSAKADPETSAASNNTDNSESSANGDGLLPLSIRKEYIASYVMAPDVATEGNDTNDHSNSTDKNGDAQEGAEKSQAAETSAAADKEGLRVVDGVMHVPPESYFKQRLVEQKKAALQSRLDKLKAGL